MGYYSEAALCLTKNGISSFNSNLAKESEAVRKSVDSLFNYATKHGNDPDSGFVCWHWQSVKWYEYDPKYFPDIDFVERQMTILDEEDYYFIRIGEDYEDTEVRGLAWDNPFGINLCREIAMDC